MKPRDYWTLSAYYAFYFALIGVWVPYWPLYLKSLSLTAQDIGLLGALWLLLKVIAAPAWGRAADRGSRRQILIISSVGTVFFYAFFFLGASFQWLLLASMLYGVFHTGPLALVEATTMEHVEHHRADYGRIRVWGSIGFILLSFIMGVVIDFWGVETILPTMLLLLMASAGITLILPKPPEKIVTDLAADHTAHHKDEQDELPHHKLTQAQHDERHLLLNSSKDDRDDSFKNNDELACSAIDVTVPLEKDEQDDLSICLEKDEQDESDDLFLGHDDIAPESGAINSAQDPSNTGLQPSILNVQKGSRQAEEDDSVLALFRKSGIRWFYLSCLLMQLSHGAYYGFLSIHLENHGYSKTVIGLLWALGVVAEVGVMTQSNKWLDWLGAGRALTLSIIVAVLRWLLFAATLWWPLLIFGQLMHAFTFGLFHIAAVRQSYEMASLEQRVTAQAWYSSLSFGVGGGIGMFVAGLLFDRIGAEALYLIMAVIGAAGVYASWKAELWFEKESHSDSSASPPQQAV